MSEAFARPTPETMLAHRQWVRRLVRVLVADVHDAADVEQETWRQALERPPPHASNLRQWLGMVARNVARKLMRTEHTRRAREGMLGSSAAGLRGPVSRAQAPTDEVTIRTELHHRVVDEVLRLSELYRVPLLLRFFDDLPTQEVARRLDVPVETARTRIKRGLGMLRQRLDAQFDLEGRDWFAALTPLVMAQGGEPAAVAAASVTATTATAAGPAALVTVGGILMSKLVKVGVVVAVVGMAVVGSQTMWSEPPAGKENGNGGRTAARETEPASIKIAEDASEPAAVVREAEPELATDPTPPPPPAPMPAIEGIVVDAAGRPVAGATVVLDRTSSNLVGKENSFRRWLRGFLGEGSRDRTWLRSMSRDDGTFAFEEVDPSHQWALGAVHDPLGAGWTDAVHFSGNPARAQVTVSLTPGVVIFGAVRDHTGQLVEGALIKFYGSSKAPTDAFTGGLSPGAFSDSARTDAEGRYRTMPLPWKHVKVHVLAWERPELMQLDIAWEELPEGEREVQRDLTLKPLTVLRGRILGTDGQAARLSQTVVPRMGADAQRVQTRETLAVAAFAQDPRVHPEILDRLRRNQPRLTFRSSDHTYGELLLDDDRYELPVSHESLRYVSVIARGRLLGTAEIPQPPFGPDIVIDQDLVPEESIVHGLRLHLRDARDYSPLEGVSVSAMVLSQTSDGGLRSSVLNFGPPKELVPDRELILPLGPCTLTLRKEGFVTRHYQIDASRRDAPVEVTLELSPTAGSIAVRVVDADGLPVEGASLRVYRTDDLEAVEVMRDRTTDEHGEARLAGLPSDHCLIVAQKNGFAPAVAEATVDENEGSEEPVVELLMERGFEVRLMARLDDGSHAPPGSFVLVDEGGAPLYAHRHLNSGSAGALWNKPIRLTAGTYSICCSVPAAYSGQTNFVASPGVEIHVELQPRRR